jgi:hypothetical protein
VSFRSRVSLLCVSVIFTALAAQPGFNGSQAKRDSDFPLFRPARVRIELKLPGMLSCDQPLRNVVLDGKKEVSIPFEIRRAAGPQGGREIITADITLNDRRIGEYAEAIVDPPGAAALEVSSRPR